MKIVVFVLFVLIVVLAFMCGLVMGQGNPKIKFIEIDQGIVKEACIYHGIDELIMDKNGLLYFYQGMKKIDNPNHFRWAPLLGNKFKNYYAEKMEGLK